MERLEKYILNAVIIGAAMLCITELARSQEFYGHEDFSDNYEGVTVYGETENSARILQDGEESTLWITRRSVDGLGNRVLEGYTDASEFKKITQD